MTTDRKAGDGQMGTFVYCARSGRVHDSGLWPLDTAGHIPLHGSRDERTAYAHAQRLGLALVGLCATSQQWNLSRCLGDACQQRHYRSWLTPQPYRGERDRILRRLAEIRGAQ